MYSFSYLEPVCCSMSSSNYCFLTCIQVSQEAGQVVWYAHLFQNFPQFIVIHTVKGFGVVNKAEIDVLLELPCFFDGPEDVGNLISSSSAFSIFLFFPLRRRFLPLTLPKRREERSSTTRGSCTRNTKSQLHVQEKMLRLFLVVLGALHDQRNFSSNKL